jgi:thiol-disulfide isomerase/thioredoxin
MSRLALFAAPGLVAASAAAQGALHDGAPPDNVLLDRLAKAELFTEAGGAASSSGFASLRGKVVFLDIWAAWCEPCVQSMPKVESIYRLVRGRPALGFLSIHDGRWERRDTTPHDFLAAHGCDYPAYIDKDKNFTDSYDWIPFVNSLPKYILIGKDGRSVKRYSEDDVQQAQADMMHLAGLPAGSKLTP